MTTSFKLSFLLSFQSNEIKLKNESLSKKPKQKASSIKMETVEQPVQRFCLFPSEFVGYAKIDYEFIPKRFKYSIEINCWKNIAKIMSVDGLRYYKTQRIGSNLWIAFTVHHFIKQLSDEELENFYSNIIAFNLSTNRTNVKSSDLEGPLYCNDCEFGEKFIEYYEENPNKIQPEMTVAKAVSYRKKKEEKEQRSAFRQGNNNKGDEVFSWLKIDGKFHSHIMELFLSKIEKNEKIYYKEPNGSTINPENQKKKATDKEISFTVPAEVFFADPKLSVFQLAGSNEVITDGYVLVTCQNLMSRIQKIDLNPLVIKVKKLSGLPVKELLECGFEELYVSLNIPDVLYYETACKIIGETVIFDESRAFFTRDLPKIKYLEYFSTRRVIAEVIGIKKTDMSTTCIFGKKTEDKDLSKRFTPNEANNYLKKHHSRDPVIIAIASYDISGIVRDMWFCREKAACHNPINHSFLLNVNHLEFLDAPTTHELNLKLLPEKYKMSPIQEGIFSKSCTFLDMEFYFMAPQFAIRTLNENATAYKRIFLNIKDISLARYIVKSVLKHNEKLLGFDIIIPEFLGLKNSSDKSKDSEAPVIENNTEELQDILTGFVIDDGDGAYIYLEGLSYGFILQIWKVVHDKNVKSVLVYINSEYVFENRLYEEFLRFGVQVITLKMSLQEIFAKSDVYLSKCMPFLCYSAFQKLIMLLQTTKIQDVLQFNLLPTACELISFSSEFGVPFRFVT